ncbi:MAG TPA: hypothetical protein VG253_01885 [Streptosporangiaceae bacterium]|nr:hypothetical protein [Streptosporangiaceae bacterium]
MRSYRELWAWLGGLFLVVFAFLAAIAIAYFLKGPHSALFGNGWMLAAGISFLVAFTCFFGAVMNWPIRPWERPGFPAVTVEIFGTGSIDTEREASSGLDVPAHLRSFNVRLTNTGTAQAASLMVLLYVRLTPGSWGRAGEAVCPPPSWTLPPSLGLSPLAMPVGLAPGESVSGQLVYEVPRYYLDKVAEPLNARLEIADEPSGTAMNIPAEMGLYDRGAMTPAAGGAEILGPEYETLDEAG